MKTGPFVLGIGLLGAIVVGSTVLVYVKVGGFSLTPSTNSADWANFGTYVGGIAGPLLSFLALVTVAWTLRLQYELLQRDRDRQMADQHVRWLREVYKDIEDLLQGSVASRSGSVTVGAILSGDRNVEVSDEADLNARLEELLKLLFHYSEAVALYRDNVTRFFDLRIFVDRGARILDRLKRFRFLVVAQPFMFEFCDMHLRGEVRRTNPEALKRQTRE